MFELLSSILEFFTTTKFISKEVIASLIASVIILILVKLLKIINIWVLNRYKKNLKLRYKYNKVVSYFYSAGSVFILAVIWNGYLPNILTFLGIFSAGVAIALKDAILNIVAGIYIILTNPFTVGDRIQINNIKGDVISTEISNFTLLEVGDRIKGAQSTGRIIHIPNSYLFIHPLINYDKGFDYIWSEIDIKFTMDSDLDKAKKMMYEIIDRNIKDVSEKVDDQISRANKDYMIYYNNLTPIIYAIIQDNCLIFTARYLAKPRQVRLLDDVIWIDIYKTFSNEEGIHLTGVYANKENLMPF
jgi:small-conductance mechanosensitive channel